MVLDQLDDGAKRLVLILCLPLVDGVFATLLVTGAVNTFSDMVAVALTVFTGAGALAVLYSHADSRAEARSMVRTAASVLFLGAVIVALVAPVFDDLFHLARLRTAAGLALVVIAAKLADAPHASKLSTEAILLTGFVLSVQNPEALTFSLSYVAPAVATALIAVTGLYAATYLRTDQLTLEYVRQGGAVAVFAIALSQLGVQVPSEVGLAVFTGSLLVAYHH